MGLVFGGLRTINQAIGSIIASLVGQDIVARSYTATQSSGADAFRVTTNGARWHIGAGASDYFTSDGTTISSAGPLRSASTLDAASNIQINGTARFFQGNVVSGSTDVRGSPANNASAVGVAFGCQTALTTAGGQISAFYSDSFTTKRAAITKDGAFNPQFTDDSATPGNRVVNTPAGANAIAIGAATCVITNSCVTANSIVLCALQFVDVTATTILSVVPAAGSFTITVDAAATAATRFGWVVFNGA